MPINRFTQREAQHAHDTLIEMWHALSTSSQQRLKAKYKELQLYLHDAYENATTFQDETPAPTTLQL